MTTEIPIFKPGTHTAMNGVQKIYTEADLVAMAQAYDADKFDAPVVLGHPEHNHPAWGWVAALSFRDGALWATLRDLHADFVGWVRDKQFKKISASFYLPDAVSNPKPGTFYLRHIGFLGAVAPSLKSLPSVNLSEADGAIVFEENMYYHPSINLMQSEPELKINHQESNQMPDKDNAKDTDNLKAKIAQLEADNASLKAQSTQYQEQADAAQTTLLQRERVAVHESHVAFCDKLAGEGRLLPTHQAVAVAALDLIAAQEKPLQFSEGDGKVELTADKFKAALQSFPVAIDFNERAADKSQPGAKRQSTMPAGFDVDPKSAELHDKALAYMDAHPGTEYIAAVTAVQ